MAVMCVPMPPCFLGLPLRQMMLPFIGPLPVSSQNRAITILFLIDVRVGKVATHSVVASTISWPPRINRINHRPRSSKFHAFKIAQTLWNLVNGFERFVFDKAEVPHVLEREGHVFLEMMPQTVELQAERTFETGARSSLVAGAGAVVQPHIDAGRIPGIRFVEDIEVT